VFISGTLHYKFFQAQSNELNLDQESLTYYQGKRLTIRVQRIDQSCLGEMQRYRQPLTQTVNLPLYSL
jgi:hypothetical protein